MMRRGLGFLGVALLLGAGVLAQSGAPASGEWTAWRRPWTYALPPLAQITAGNFSKLEVAGVSKRPVRPRPEYQFESTPLMVNGLVYSTAGTPRCRRARCGQRRARWMHSEQEGARGTECPRQLSGRGLSCWTDGRENASSTSRPAIAWWPSTR